MFWKQWRDRLTYLVMSVFVGWHTLAIVVAPAPESGIEHALHPLLQPYLSLFRQDNSWDFFSPTVSQGQQFRYMIEDAAGTSHTFVPVEELSRFHPITRRFTYWYDAIVESPEDFVDYLVAYLCQKHASLHPISITLLGVEQGDFSPADQLGGKHPLDSEFVTETTLKHDTCPD